MARFRFKLQPVLELRERAEKEEQRAVANIEAARVELEARLRAYHAQIEDERSTWRTRLTGGADIADARLRANAALRLQHKANMTVLELSGVYKRLESARRRLVEATARRRAMELLRDRQRDAWRAAILKKEQDELDEISTLRFGRSAPGSPARMPVLKSPPLDAESPESAL